MILKKFLLVILIFSSFNVIGQPSIIPQPVSYSSADGYFTITPTTFIYCNDIPSFFDAISFRDIAIQYYDLALKTGHELFYDRNYIEVKYDSTLQLPDEGYKLIVTPEKITITGKNNGAVFYGLMTLFQMIESPTTRNFRIPCAEVTDYPRFSYRGMHLDCSRHFFGVEFIKRYIDYLALYKYNTFHWHLTDDQGWRIEIKQYPKLTEIGAWRNGSMIGRYSDQQFDTIRYGGFYTQKEIKEIVKYAEKKHVTIIPEIEMPGHCLAALASYPAYSCTPDAKLQVGEAWGGYPDIFCPTEETFTFLENILNEVIELFPSQYIHIGGDEVEKTRWKESAFCQQLIKEKNLGNEDGLQSYFIKRIEEYLNSKGKKLIGWDEILDGGIAPNATIMSWRGEEGGIAAAQQNHFAIMTPGKFCYFDHYQGNLKNEPVAIGGYTPLAKVYSYEPIPAILNSEQSTYILGAQGNVWTEYISTPQQVEYMAIPRMIALSEVLWSPKEKRNYNEFVSRLLDHFTLLDKIDCNYSKSLYQVNYNVLERDGGGLTIQLTTFPFPDYRLQYRIKSEGPSFYDYEGSFPVFSDTKIDYSIIVNHGEEYTGDFEIHFNKATGKNIELLIPPSNKYPGDGPFTLINGIEGTTYPGWSSNEWLGYSGSNCEVVVDLGDTTRIHSVKVGCLDDRLSWIWPAANITCYYSNDGIKFIQIKNIKYIEILERHSKIDFAELTARYVKITITNFGVIPDGNPGAGHNAWLFIDEVSVE